jgi:hypothetical protein
LTCVRTEDLLNVIPKSALTPELISEIREHKMEIIRIMREDVEMLRTDLALGFFSTDAQQGTA